MKTLKSRILSGVMAGVLAVSMAVPAFAAENTPSNTTTNITGSYEEIPIEVTVPQNGAAQINPYGLPVALDDDNSIAGEQIVTRPIYIVNDGKVDLKVSASVTAVAKGDLKFVAAAPAETDTYKSAFVYLQMKASTLAESDRATTSIVTAGKDISGFDPDAANAEIAAWKQDYAAAKDLVLVNEKAAEKANMVILAGKQESATSTGTFEYVAGSAAMVRLAGKVTESPREAWSDKDGFTAAVAFTFKPDFTSATLDETAVTLANVNDTKDLTVALTGANITDVAWTSSDASKVKVEVKATPTDKTVATVTGVASGTATITATVTADNGMTYTATCEVTVS